MYTAHHSSAPNTPSQHHQNITDASTARFHHAHALVTNTSTIGGSFDWLAAKLELPPLPSAGPPLPLPHPLLHYEPELNFTEDLLGTAYTAPIGPGTVTSVAEEFGWLPLESFDSTAPPPALPTALPRAHSASMLMDVRDHTYGQHYQPQAHAHHPRALYHQPTTGVTSQLIDAAAVLEMRAKFPYEQSSVASTPSPSHAYSSYAQKFWNGSAHAIVQGAKIKPSATGMVGGDSYNNGGAINGAVYHNATTPTSSYQHHFTFSPGLLYSPPSHSSVSSVSTSSSSTPVEFDVDNEHSQDVLLMDGSEMAHLPVFPAINPTHTHYAAHIPPPTQVIRPKPNSGFRPSISVNLAETHWMTKKPDQEPTVSAPTVEAECDDADTDSDKNSHSQHRKRRSKDRKRKLSSKKELDRKKRRFTGSSQRSVNSNSSEDDESDYDSEDEALQPCDLPIRPKPVHVRSSLHRSKLPMSVVQLLRSFFLSHINFPFPTDSEKSLLVENTNLTHKQICDWFTNNRKRYWRIYEKKLIKLNCGLVRGNKPNQKRLKLIEKKREIHLGVSQDKRCKCGDGGLPVHDWRQMWD